MHLRTHNLLDLGQLRWKDGSDDVCAAFEGVTRTNLQQRSGASAGMRIAHSALSGFCPVTLLSVQLSVQIHITNRPNTFDAPTDRDRR